MTEAARSEDAWTLRRLLTWTTQHFDKRKIDAPRLTAELLLAHLLKVARVRLYVDLDRPMEKSELTAFRALIERRLKGEPTQYLTGTRDFYGRTFQVDARVLIPRPETELLVEAALRHLPKDEPTNVLDVCTGSGCVGISIALERKNARVLATDLSPDAIQVARANAERLGVLDRFEVREGNLAAPALDRAPFDVIVSNPPYIASAEIATLSAEVRQEPRLALDGGADGLDLIRRVLTEAKPLLVPGGFFALEMGETQGAAVLALLQSAGYEGASVQPDLERRDRLAFGYQPPRSASRAARAE